MKLAKRVLSVLLMLSLMVQLVGCAFTEKAGEYVDIAKEKVSSATDAIAEWYRSIDLSKFEEGWKTAKDYVGSAYSSVVTSEYIENVGIAINNLKKDINSATGSARGIAQEAGYAAEKWAADTFNIDSAVRGSSYSAEVVGSTELGSVDVTTNYGEEASLKYYQSANGSAKAQATAVIEAYTNYYNQAKNNATKEPLSLDEYLDEHGFEIADKNALYESLYSGQTRIIPTDQLENAKKYLQGRVDKLSSIEGTVASTRAEAYQETLKNLKDRLTAPDGTQSKPITYEEMQAIAELSQTGDFKPEDFGITLSQVIPAKYVLKQAMGTGLEAGLLRTVFEVGPDIVSIIAEGIKTGDIEENAIEEAGIEGAIALGEGFVEGSVSSIVVTLCKEGALGETLKNVSPDVVGALVFLTIEAVITGYSLATGDITASEYGCLMADKSLITLLAIPTSAAMIAVLPGTKMFMLIGCLAGGIIASTGYQMVKDVVVEFADGGGFEAIVPEGVATKISSAKEAVASIDFSEHISNLKDFAVSTYNDGLIKIQAVVSKKD